MVLWDYLKLYTKRVVSGLLEWDSGVGQVQSLPEATWYKTQSDLQKVATCAGIRGVWERLSCKLRLDAPSVMPGAA